MGDRRGKSVRCFSNSLRHYTRIRTAPKSSTVDVEICSMLLSEPLLQNTFPMLNHIKSVPIPWDHTRNGPFRVPPARRDSETQIGAMRGEQQGTASGRGDGTSQSRQLAVEGSRGVAGTELSATQTSVWAWYRGGGAQALQHFSCGRVSNRSHAGPFRQAVLGRVRDRYNDFGHSEAFHRLLPLAARSLLERDLTRPSQ